MFYYGFLVVLVLWAVEDDPDFSHNYGYWEIVFEVYGVSDIDVKEEE